MRTRAAVIITDTHVTAAQLRRQRRGWTVVTLGRVPLNESTSTRLDGLPEGLAAALRAALAQAGATGLPIDLLIPAGWCFLRRFETNGRRFAATAAAYEFEEYLPLPLEELTCTFVHAGRGPAWGVAVPTRPLRHLLDELEERGLDIAHVRVDVFAALAVSRPGAAVAGIALLDARRAVLAWQCRDDVLPAVVRTSFGPAHGDAAPELPHRIELTERAVDLHAEAWMHCDLCAELHPAADPALPVSATSPAPGVNARPGALSLEQILSAATQGRHQPDLRTGALGPSVQRARLAQKALQSVSLLVLMLGLLGLDLYRRQMHYRAELAEVRQGQVELFEQLFPETPVPANPALRCASECKRLAGLAGSGEAVSSPSSPAADRPALLDDLCGLIAALPRDVRITLLELNLDAQQLACSGQSGDHRDAERIAESVGTLPGLEARPPRTSRLATGCVEFSIRAQRGHDHAASNASATPGE